MSDKKDDHAHGGGHEKPKKSLASVLKGISVAIILILIFVYYLGASVPMVVNGTADLVANTGQSFGNLGKGFQQMTGGIRGFFIGFNGMLIEILMRILQAGVILALLMLVGRIFSKLRGGKKEVHAEKGHDQAHH